MKSMICTNPITRLPILGSRRDSLVSPVIPDVFDSEPAFEGRQGPTVGHAGEPVTLRGALRDQRKMRPKASSRVRFAVSSPPAVDGALAARERGWRAASPDARSPPNS